LFDSEIEGFIDALILERGLSKNTCDAYARDLRLFANWLKSKDKSAASQITLSDITEFLASERRAGMLSTTRARRTAAIRMWLKHLKERRIVSNNPSELMESPKKGRSLPKVLSEEEIIAMIEAVNGDDPRSIRDRAILECLYSCGFRVTELCDFAISDIVADGELIRIFGKGSKERLVPIGGVAGRALLRYLNESRATFARDNLAETHVFLTRLGKQFTRQGIFKIIRERAAFVGIAAERVSPHVLRHCFASHMLSRGADIRAIQELLGHADVGTTQIYTHVDAAKFADIHQQHHPRA
jgi:integrase/recombinase XerD